nr:ribonuclease H-like domain-containing protein [Tanacetum cinerariifolium]
MNHQTSTVPQVAYQSPQAPTQLMTESPFVDSGFVVHVFSPEDDPIACLNKAMAFLTVIASSRQGLLNAITVKVKDMWLGNALSLSDKGMLHGQAQTIIPHNAAFQNEDLDTYDSDCDGILNAQAVLMANISNYAKQAFWLCISNPTIESYLPHVRVEVPIRLPNVSLVNESLKKLKFQLAQFDSLVKKRTTPNALTEAQLKDKDTTICKLKDTIKSLRKNNKEKIVDHDRCDLATINEELENSVAKLLSKNKRLCKEINHVKQGFKDQFDSIKQTCVLQKEQCDSLINKLDLKYTKHEDLKAQIQDKVFVITSLKYDLRKLKGKAIVDNAAQIPSATTVVLGMLKLDLKPLAPKLMHNRECHIFYLKHIRTKLIFFEELLVNVRDISPSAIRLSETKVDQIVLWYLDFGCSKHMTGNRSQLMNFVSKFLGTVRFGNEKIARIMGYGDYQLGKVVISRVYYVERLGHNLFSVGQFCDADLEVAFRKNTCFIRDLEGVDLISGTVLSKGEIRTLVEAAQTMLIFSKAPLFLWAEAITTACYTQNHSLIRHRYNKTPSELMQHKKPDLSFLHVFGSLCYPINEHEDLGPGLHVMTPATASTGLVSNPVSQKPCISPNRDDWDRLFQSMFDEYFNPLTIAVFSVQEAAAPRAKVLADSPVSISISQDALSISISSSQAQEHSPITQQLNSANALGPPLGFVLALAQVTGPAHYITPAQTHVTGPVPFVTPSAPIGLAQAVAYPVAPTAPQVNPGSVGTQETTLPHAFTTATLRDFSNSAWNMNTCASSHLNNSVNSLSENFNACMYPSISIGDGRSIPVTNTDHSILPTPFISLHLNNVLLTPHIVKNLIYVCQFVRDNNYTIEFDALGFSIKDFMTRRVLLRCDSTGDLYPVTVPSPFPHVFLVSQHTRHQRLGHPRRELLRYLVSNNFISCNKEKPLVLCHAFQLSKHVSLPFVNSGIFVTSCFEIIYSDMWTSPIRSLLGFKYYVLFLDYYSQFVWVYPLLNKSDVWSKFVLFRTYVRTQFKCEICSFQCDHGGEFDNHNFHKLFADNGIQFCFSCPKTSQQNGQASNHNGYRCLDLKTNKIISSRHVTFDETVFPYGSTQPASPPTYTFLDDIPDIIPPIPLQLPLEPITPIHNTPIQHHHNATHLPTPPQQLLSAQVQTTKNQAHSSPPTTSMIQQRTPTSTQSPATQHGPTTQSPIIIHDPPENPNPVSIHPMVIRFRVGTNRFTERLNLQMSSIYPLPKSYYDAFSDPNWQNAMQNGTLSRYKACLVVNGSTQLEGVDVDETFSLVVKPVYMHQPPGFQDSVHPDYVCLLQRSLYGLKQASRAWIKRFASYITRVGFSHSRCASSLFIYRQGTDTAYVLLYVDDIVLTASSKILPQQIIISLHQEFAMTNLGLLNYFLDISVSRDSLGLFLSKKKYAAEILDRAHMVNCNPSRTPIDTESKLGSDGDPVSDLTLYRSLAGSLQYLTFTRPDISYAVQQVCLYMHDHRKPQFASLKWILRYVRGTLDYGLQLFSSSTTTDLVAYSDTDWAGCLTNRRSTSGYCVFLATTYSFGPLSANRRFLVPVQRLSIVVLPMLLLRLRTKHIEIDIHFVRDLVVASQVRVLHVPSRYQFADIFTKGLPSALFEEFRSSLSVRCPPALTAREC